MIFFAIISGGDFISILMTGSSGLGDSNVSN